jgi:hypothetical protein
MSTPESLHPSDPTPKPETAPPAAAPEPVPVIDDAKVAEFLREAHARQSLSKAAAAGLVAALVGAAAWGGISFASNYQIGWMAVGVGFLVGWAVRFAGKSFDKSFGYLGAGLSLLGCLLGNIFMIAAVVANQHSVSIFEVLSRITPAVAFDLLKVTFSPMDLLFYGIALYYGYRTSFRRLTDAELAHLTAPPQN